MLQKLNERIQGLITWIIVGLFTLAFSLVGLSYFMQSHQDNDIRAKVNGKVISKQALESSYRRVSQMKDSPQMNSDTAKELKRELLSEMIINLASVDAASTNGFAVDNVQAAQAIMSIPQFQQDGRFSSSRYTQVLSNAFYTPQTFQQEVRQGMLLNQQRFALIGTAFVLPNELNQFVDLSMQTRDYAYARIKADDFKNKLDISSQDLESYYQKHRSEFYSKEQLSIAYLQVSLQDFKAKIKLSSDEVQRYYQDHKTDYLEPAEWQCAYIRFPLTADSSKALEEQSKQEAEALHARLLEHPEQFEQMNQDKRLEQGTAPLMRAGQSGLDKYLISLTKPGQISAPIRTQAGYEIFRLIAYTPSKAKSFQDVSPLIRQQLYQEQAQKLFAKKVQELADLSYQNPDSLDSAAKALHLPIQHSELFSREGGKDSISQNKLVIEAAFSPDVLRYGNNSELIQLEADKALILRVDQHQPRALLKLEQVKEQISKRILEIKATEAAKNFGENIIQHRAEESAVLNWQTLQSMTRDSDTEDSRINQLAFSIDNLKEYKGLSLENGDFILVKLMNVSNTRSEELDKDQLANIRQHLESNYGLMDYDLYINHLMDLAKVVHYDK